MYERLINRLESALKEAERLQDEHPQAEQHVVCSRIKQAIATALKLEERLPRQQPEPGESAEPAVDNPGEPEPAGNETDPIISE